MYVMTSEPITTAYFVNPFRQSVSISLVLLLGNGSVRRYRDKEYTSKHGRNVGHVTI
jgi:hypothetical protein